jgi:phosphoribosylanthranilate isomerase
MKLNFKFPVPRVKICCISSTDEALMAIRSGADALGLVSQMPSGPGVISEERIAEISAVIPPGVTSVLLTSNQSAEQIISQHHRCRTNAIQICDRLIHGNYNELRQSLPGISLIQVIHVTGEESYHEASKLASEVDALLLDSGNRSAGRIELGGTGRTHNWTISRRICQNVDTPVFLAGGLNPDNVREAIDTVRPFAVDVCSGVRTDGTLDKVRLKSFMDQVKDQADKNTD